MKIVITDVFEKKLFKVFYEFLVSMEACPTFLELVCQEPLELAISLKENQLYSRGEKVLTLSLPSSDFLETV